MDELIRTIAVYALPLLFAITVHEAAHGYVAKYFGDNTAYAAGRLSLDPFKHIDPFGTILLPIILFLVSKGSFVFGYAKPVPVNFGALRNPRKQSAWVALAGPLVNYAMAFGWLILGLVVASSSGADGFLYEVAGAGVRVNLIMFALNMLPIPPLDGGRVLTSMLPPRLGYKFAQIEPYGMFIVIALMVLHLLEFWVFGLAGYGALVLQKLTIPLQLFLH